jgi:hypothetical protein
MKLFNTNHEVRESLTDVGNSLIALVAARDRLLRAHAELLSAFEAYESCVEAHDKTCAVHDKSLRASFAKADALMGTLRALDAEKRLASEPTKA